LRQHSVDLSGENCTRIHEVLKKTVADNVEAGWQPFSQELDEALGGEKVPLRDSFERKLAFRLRARSLAVPILRRRLLNPLNMLERFELIEREEAQIVMHRDTSRGLKHARLLQEDYIGRDVGGLEKGIHTFFETRGMTAEVTFSRFKNLQPGHVPAILVGPDNAAGLLLGYIDVDGEQFALVFFPKTGSPSVMTLAEKARAIRKERGIPEPNEAEDTEFQESLQQVREAEARLRKIRQEKGLPDLPQEETAEERVWKAIDRMKKLEEELIVVEDRHSELPGSLEHGVHLVRCSGLASWGALYIGKLVAAENWGVLPWRELMHEL
jgi:hypothetical protein